jgi:Cu(I)/Ag(I) efflux system membrane fusion protein
MKNNTIFSNKYLNYSLILIAGLFLGWFLFHSRSNTAVRPADEKEVVQEDTIWTCSMHPQIRMPEPGKCPICGMDLIPLTHAEETAMDMDNDAIHMTPDAAQLANVETTVVTGQTPEKEVRLYGKVEPDERLLQSQVAHIAGRIENLYVNFTGETVTAGQVLGQVYSPELVTAQQELLEAVRVKDDQPALYEAAKEKLLQWKLTGKQVSQIESTGKTMNTVDIVSNTSGVIIARKVNKGDYVTQGSILYEIADLLKVWIVFDAYESDLPFLQSGEKVSFELKAMPGVNHTGKIIFIDPVIDPLTRIAGVRAEADNRDGNLKPGMFATGIVSTVLKGYENNPVIPRSSVLWTGRRSVVYVRQSDSEDPVFKMREVELGPELGDGYVVISGLGEGEEIVTNGTFSVDAAAQLEGKPSMMNH